jgi:pyruvate formate lyase activating enzyme
MIIGGLQQFSLLDYPGCVSAIVFTQGCNFRCQFCYNPMLVWPETVGKLKYARDIEQQKDHPKIKEDDLFVFLESRAGKLDAVVVTGGEPCLHKDLTEFIQKIKKLGFLVKLDTNGSYPETLEKLLEKKLIDYIAMDLKAPAEKYDEITGIKGNFNNIQKSVKLIMQSGLPYEFRTTVVPNLLNKDDINEMGKIIKGARAWYLQGFKSSEDLINQALKNKVPYNSRQMKEMADIGSKYVKKCEVR